MHKLDKATEQAIQLSQDVKVQPIGNPPVELPVMTNWVPMEEVETQLTSAVVREPGEGDVAFQLGYTP